MRVDVVGSCAYVSLVLPTRTYAKRTLSRPNAFDFVVTIALGSILGGMILARSVSLAAGAAALMLLMSWPCVFTSLGSPFSGVRDVLASDARLLGHKGQVIANAMRAERLSNEEIIQALRVPGFADLGDVASVGLKHDGSVIMITSNSEARINENER